MEFSKTENLKLSPNIFPFVQKLNLSPPTSIKIFSKYENSKLKKSCRTYIQYLNKGKAFKI